MVRLRNLAGEIVQGEKDGSPGYACAKKVLSRFLGGFCVAVTLNRPETGEVGAGNGPRSCSPHQPSTSIRPSSRGPRFQKAAGRRVYATRLPWLPQRLIGPPWMPSADTTLCRDLGL